ncbi:IniB N-terminal domain-containing protein [Microbacterium kyungheense]|uniref:Uncharacterized protein n=1 Tax=Microbacterium kyungheense TaxID=1263636 RepID=A0A543FJT3_9MICO|nr:IniB N-terminal domain-containing protein [Microbacterium kyungheense]TQM34139.1 hypothetical protein FB391_0426 [Microbacterium kyungheense]
MTTPLATVANSIIEFILSLLRDPAALKELEDDPETTLAKNKLAGLCADDVRAVAPVIYDRPDVVPRTAAHPQPASTHAAPASHADVVNELTRITTSWTMIDNRSTIIDQSVNQNIWTEGGDVSQIFDQSAGIASGDGSIAAGEDTTIDNSSNVDADAGDDTLAGLPGVVDPPDDATDAAPGAEAGAGAGVGAGSGSGSDADSADDADAGAAVPVETDLDALAEETVDQQAMLQPDEQLAASVDAGVPQDAVDVVESVPSVPAYDAPAPEVDDAVWSEPAEPAVVDEVAYADDLTEEQ